MLEQNQTAQSYVQPSTRQSAQSPASPCLPLLIKDFDYRKQQNRLLNGVNLELHAGKVTMVMGFNGAGKSLLLRAMCGLIDGTNGSVTWNGRAMNEQIREQLAIIFQKPVLLRRSVAANIDYVLKLRGKRSTVDTNKILDTVGLADFASRPARLLSGGEQQRLALARALALAPQMLLLDEPTASLDPASALIFEQTVMAAAENGTKMVFVTHDVAQARRLADEVVFLHQGRITEHSQAAVFFSKPNSQAAADYLEGRLPIDVNDAEKSMRGVQT